MRENNLVFYFTGPRLIEARKTILCTPNDDYVQIKFIFCGICGGDYSAYIGRRKNYPVSLGHEFVGEIVQVGKNIKHLAVGDIVVSDFNFRCGSCHQCVNLQSHLCIKNDIQLFTNRGFAHYANVHFNYIFSAPTIKPVPQSCFIEPLSCAIHAVKTCRIEPDSKVLVVGCGNIGSMVCMYLKKVMGLRRVSVCETNAERLAKIKTCFGVAQANKLDTYDWIVECSNTINGVKTALGFTSPGGSLCIISHIYGLETSFIYEQICKKEIRAVFPLRNGASVNMLDAINYISNYWENSYNILYKVYDSINTAFEEKESCSFNRQIIKCF